MKQIIIVGSGTQHMDREVVEHYLSGDSITIGPVYNGTNCMVHDYYLWSANSFKVQIMMKKRVITPPRIKSIIVGSKSTTPQKIITHYKDEFNRLKGEFYHDKPWENKAGLHSSTGLMTFFYVLDQFENIESIIFLGCSALAGDCTYPKVWPHKFDLESAVIKKEMKERNITANWIHQEGIY